MGIYPYMGRKGRCIRVGERMSPLRRRMVGAGYRCEVIGDRRGAEASKGGDFQFCIRRWYGSRTFGFGGDGDCGVGGAGVWGGGARSDVAIGGDAGEVA